MALGKYQMVNEPKPFFWKGLTKNNHLGSAFGLRPQSGANTMIRLMEFQNGPSLESLLNGVTSVREFETDDEYTWKVIGSSRRNVPLLEARDENGQVVTKESGMVGAGTAPFYLVFPFAWFAKGEYIVGELNEAYQFRVLEDERMEGTNAVYRVELGGGNTKGCPAERLLSGERFSVEAAYVEKELSRKVGTVRYSTPISMRNEWSVIRKYTKVPGSMLNKKLAVGIPCVEEQNGKRVRTVKDMWMHVVEWNFEKEWSEEKNNVLAFSVSNRNKNGEYMNFGDSGNVISQGDGLYAQMARGNVKYYNTFSLKHIEDALYTIGLNLGMKDRTFILRTGEKGAIQFHKAVYDTVSGWRAFTFNGDAVGAIQKTSSDLHQTSLAAGFQFTELRAPNNAIIKVIVDRSYDDPVRNKIQHPNGGPAKSYQYDIFALGSSDEPNIVRCKLKGQDEYRGYQWGPFANPFTGQTNNGSASYDEDSASIHAKWTGGICIYDPNRTMQIIPDILNY